MGYYKVFKTFNSWICITNKFLLPLLQPCQLDLWGIPIPEDLCISDPYLCTHPRTDHNLSSGIQTQVPMQAIYLKCLSDMHVTYPFQMSFCHWHSYHLPVTNVLMACDVIQKGLKSKNSVFQKVFVEIVPKPSLWGKGEAKTRKKVLQLHTHTHTHTGDNINSTLTISSVNFMHSIQDQVCFTWKKVKVKTDTSLSMFLGRQICLLLLFNSFTLSN